MVFLTTLLKIFGPTTTIGKWLRDKYEKRSYHLYHFAKSLNLDSEKKNFEIIYHNALKKLSEQKQEDVFELFNLQDIRDAYKDEFQRKGLPNGVYIQLDYQVSNKEKFALLKNSITSDEKEFRALLQSEISSSLSAQEQHQEGHFLIIEEKLDKLVEYNTNMTSSLNEGAMLRIEESLETFKLNTAAVPGLQKEVQQLREQQAIHTEQIRSLQIAQTTRSYDGEILQIITLANGNAQQAAIRLFEAFRTAHWSELDDEQRYDLAIHAAKAHFELAQHDKAAFLFTELPFYNQHSAEGYGLAALGYAMQDQNALANAALSKAFVIDPQSSHAILANIDLLPENGTLAELLALVPSHLLENAMIGLEVAKRINADYPERRHKALEILQKLATESEPNTLTYFEVIELTAIVRSSRAIAIYLESGKALTHEVNRELESALSMYSEAWNYYKDSDLRTTKWHVLANRGVAYKVMGNFKEAKQDFMNSIFIKPTPFTYISLIALLAENRQPMLDTIQEIKKSLLLSDEQKQDLLPMEITALLDEKYYEDALTLIEQAKEKSSDEVNIMWESMKCHAILMLEKGPEAIQLAISLAEKYPESVHANYTASEIAFRTGDHPMANSYLDKTVASLPADCQLNPLEHVAALAVSLERHQTVIDLLDIERFTQVFSKFTFRLLTSLYIAGRLDRAFEIAMPLFNGDTDEPLVWQIIIEYNEMTGNLPEAQKVAQKGIAMNSNDPYFHAKVLAIQLKQQAIANAQLTVNTLPEKFDGNNTIFNVLYNVALSAGQPHFTRILQWAYERRAKNLQDSQVHQHYIHFMQGLSTMGYQEPRLQTIAKDTCVELEAEDGKTLFITIEDQKLVPNSLVADSDLAKGLIGMKIGETILINNILFAITHITSKYMFAYLGSTGILKSARSIDNTLC